MPSAAATREAGAAARKQGTPTDPATKPSALYVKTQMCKFQASGRCKRGSWCFFAHSSEEQKDTPDLKCTRICPQIQKGNRCTNTKCTYAHRRAELRAPVIAPQQVANSASAGAPPLPPPPPFANFAPVPKTMAMPATEAAAMSAKQLSGLGIVKRKVALAAALAELPQPSEVTDETLFSDAYLRVGDGWEKVQRTPQQQTGNVTLVKLPIAVIPMPSAGPCAVQGPPQDAAESPMPAPRSTVVQKLNRTKGRTETVFSRRTTADQFASEGYDSDPDSFSWDLEFEDSEDEQDLYGFEGEEKKGNDGLPPMQTPNWRSQCSVEETPSQSTLDKMAPTTGKATHDVQLITKNTFLELVPTEGEEVLGFGVRRAKSSVI